MLDPKDPTVALIIQGIRNCYAATEAVATAVSKIAVGTGALTPAEAQELADALATAKDIQAKLDAAGKVL